MNVALFYRSAETINIDSVFVVGNFLSNFSEPIEMKQEGDLWKCEIDLLPGEYLYKFLLNQELPIFDPFNNLFEQDSEGELWSLIMINSEGERLLNPERYHINLTSYQLLAGTDKKYLRGYSEVVPPKVVATIICDNITGVHGVTAAWYAPDKTLYEYSENIICAEGDESVSIKFWIDYGSAYSKYTSGQWCFRLFINGVLIIEDFFLIASDEISYS